MLDTVLRTIGIVCTLGGGIGMCVAIWIQFDIAKDRKERKDKK